MDSVSLTPLPQTIALAAYAHYQLVERATVGLVGYLWFFERMPRLFYPLWSDACRRGGVPEKAQRALAEGAVVDPARDLQVVELLPADRAPAARPRPGDAEPARHRGVVRDDGRRRPAARRAAATRSPPESAVAARRDRPGRLIRRRWKWASDPIS